MFQVLWNVRIHVCYLPGPNVIGILMVKGVLLTYQVRLKCVLNKWYSSRCYKKILRLFGPDHLLSLSIYNEHYQKN